MPAHLDVYRGQSQCKQCGMKSEDLKDEALPRIVRKFGNVIRLRCWICGNQWLVADSRSQDASHRHV
jgi:hypothetical protein